VEVKSVGRDQEVFRTSKKKLTFEQQVEKYFFPKMRENTCVLRCRKSLKEASDY